ncbi:unnamed protein product, partial [Rotaria sp. Silwood2]
VNSIIDGGYTATCIDELADGNCLLKLMNELENKKDPSSRFYIPYELDTKGIFDLILKYISKNTVFIDQIYSSSTIPKETKQIPEVYGAVDTNERVDAFSDIDVHRASFLIKLLVRMKFRNKGIDHLDFVNTRELDLIDNIYDNDLGHKDSTSTEVLESNVMSLHGYDLIDGANGAYSGVNKLKNAQNSQASIMSSCALHSTDDASGACSDVNNLKNAQNLQSYTFDRFEDLVNTKGKERGSIAVYNKKEKCEHCREKNPGQIIIFAQTPCVFSWSSLILYHLDCALEQELFSHIDCSTLTAIQRKNLEKKLSK